MSEITLTFLISLLVLTGCNGNTYVGYQPPLVPAKVSIDTNGDLVVSWEGSYQTPIGTFFVGTSYDPVQLFPDAQGILTVRVDNEDTLYDLGGRDIEITLDSGYYKQVSLRKTGENWYFEVARIEVVLLTPTHRPQSAPPGIYELNLKLRSNNQFSRYITTIKNIEVFDENHYFNLLQ
jgi:hypothetical protein